ncbi:MAG: VOC family protein [Acidobacteriota bacterium]|nr:VOC family protein [Acidobacteriota bacterium]
MVTGGNATVYITNMTAALAFYTEVLGMQVTSHYGDHWATVAAGGFTVGLHPESEKYARPGTPGSIQVGLNVAGSIEAAREKLVAAGAKSVGEVLRGEGGNFVHFTDPDGNALYLWGWS